MMLVDELSWCQKEATRHMKKVIKYRPEKEQAKELAECLPFNKWLTNKEIAKISDIPITDNKAYRLMTIAVKQNRVEVKRLRINSVTINKYRRIK